LSGAKLIDINNYDTIIWDWNGTIVDDSRLAFDIYIEECDLYGLEKMTWDEYKSRFYFPVKKFYEEVGLPSEKYAEVADRFSIVYREKWQEIKIHPQVEEYLQKFKNKSQFILSAYRQDELRDMVKFYGIENYFIEIAGVEDNLAHSKVERGKKLFEKHKIIPEKTLMFGDTEHDFEVAKEFGIEIILLSWGTISHEKLIKKAGEKTVFADLKGAFEE
jgi:phosphoglycolate phosphatase